MKKIILLAAVITVASFTSCKKAAKCECTTTMTSQTVNGTAVSTSGSWSQTTTKEISKTGKKTAAAMCGNETTVDTQTNGSTTTVTNYATTCSVK